MKNTFRAEEKYNFDKLGNQSDASLAREWGISRERVRQFRKQKNIEKSNFFDRENINKKIIEYLKQNKDKKITLYELKEYLCSFFNKMATYSYITKEYVKLLGEKYSIEVLFTTGVLFEHSYTSYRTNKCKCLICTACGSVLMWLYNHKFEYHCQDVNYFVNKYFDLYELDTSKMHKNFYAFMINELKLKKKDI